MNACKRVVKVEYQCTCRTGAVCDFKEINIDGYCDWLAYGFCQCQRAIEAETARAMMEEDECDEPISRIQERIA